MAKKSRVKPPVAIGKSFEEKCGHCQGTGQEPGLPDLTCRECIGRGRRRWRVEGCTACNGQGKTGLFSLFKCEPCRGRGWILIDVG